MLSGGRTDDGTFERLLWHIKRAIKWYDENNKERVTSN